MKGGTPSTGSGAEFQTFFAEAGPQTVTVRVYRNQRLLRTLTEEIRVYTSGNEVAVFGNPIIGGRAIRSTVASVFPDYRVQLIDASGRQVYGIDYTDAPCTQEVSIPTDRLAAGVYYLMYVRQKETFGKLIVVL